MRERGEEWKGGREEGRRDGGEEKKGWRRGHTRRRRQCLLISGVERDKKLQTGWQAGRWATFSAQS